MPRGYDEIITYSFISPTYYDKIDLPKDSALRDSLQILNPLGEDTSIMRTTTLPSMLEILTRNYNFRNKSAKLYELGRVYFKRADGLADEPKVLTPGRLRRRHGLLHPQGRCGSRLEAACGLKMSASLPIARTPPTIPAAVPRSTAATACWARWGRSTPMWRTNYGVGRRAVCCRAVV